MYFTISFQVGGTNAACTGAWAVSCTTWSSNAMLGGDQQVNPANHFLTLVTLSVACLLRLSRLPPK
jgi:hypothetical protein